MTILRIAILVTGLVSTALSQGTLNAAATDVTQAKSASAEMAQITTEDEAVDRAIQREHEFLLNVKNYSPVVETYIQMLRPDAQLGTVPSDDRYFLGRVDFSFGVQHKSFTGDDEKKGFGHHLLDNLSGPFSIRFVPGGFAAMVMLDANDFDRQHYSFEYVRREFLGDVRCLVYDVKPAQRGNQQRFEGRIWIEDQDFNIVRFNGIYTPQPRHAHYLHFDSWRMNLRPGQWLPAYVYTEESDLKYSMMKQIRLKGQTRFWGYSLSLPGHQQEMTSMTVEDPFAVRDHSESAQDLSPVQAQRVWERVAEDNVVERLYKSGLLAPTGEVDKVLLTVVNNLEITNQLDIQPEVRCRVLLTSSLESFTIGHTIVISRGLLDVLPDEPSLAMVLAHELGHIALGHRLDTKYAFDDRMLFPDEQSFQRIQLKRDELEEAAADQKGMALLANSPYKDKLSGPGQFLRALGAKSKDLPHLISAHLGNRLAKQEGSVRMAEVMQSATPEAKTDELAALPLGGRIKVDPWSDRIEMVKRAPVPLLSDREKLQFEVTPFMLYLTRQGAKQVAANAPESANAAESKSADAAAPAKQ